MLTKNGQEAVSTRDLAWNSLSTSENLADGPMTAADVLDKAGLAGWDVRAVPMTTALGDHPGAFNDAGLIVPERFATVATIDGTSKVLGDVGNRYKIFQNEETAELLDTIVDDSGAHFVAAGSMANHKRTFVVMKMPQSIMVGGEDAHDLYFGVTNRHDGNGSLVAWTTMARLRCTNMIDSAVKHAKSKWSLRHTAGMKGKVAEARESLKLTFAWAEAFEGEAQEFLDSPFSDADFDRLLDELAPESESEHEGWRKRQDEKRDTLRHLFREADTNELGRGTKWGAYNAFTEYADWFAPVKGADPNGSRRAERNLDGTNGANFKQAAWDALVAA